MSDTVHIGSPSAPLDIRPAATGKNYYKLITPKLKPYKHQERGMNAAVSGFLEQGYHALFMEMGTGKTKTTIDAFMALVALKKASGLVIVAPKAILSVWASEELPKHLTLDYSLYTWDGRTTKAKEAEFDAAMKADTSVFLVNVESFQTLPEAMRTHLRSFLSSRRCLMAVDESSYIKSHDAKRSIHVTQAGKLAEYRTILTGTEITKSILDLYQQFEFLRPGFWGVKSYFLFRARYAILEDQYGAGGRTFKKVVGFKSVNELLGRIEPYCTRALKKDCLDLPPKVFQTIHVDLSPAQAKAYKQLKDHLATLVGEAVLTVPNKIALFTKFRQIVGGMVNVEGEKGVVDADPPKLQALVADLSGTDEQAIIWACFTHEIDMIANALSPLGLAVKFYGETSQADRDEAKAMFQSGAARFMVINPQCGAYGLNFQHCHLDYTYSRSLRPSDTWQGQDRIHRSGQTETCVYKALVARGTVDERIEELIASSTDIREKIQDMTIEDMVRLL